MGLTEAATAQGLAARLGAVELVRAVLDEGAMLDEGRLPGAVAKASPPERAQARALADLTLRRRGQIDDLLRGFVPKAPRTPVNHILRVMAAELLFARTAAHAAVDTAVRTAKQLKAGKMAGLINAVGRRITREGAEVISGQDAAALAMPDWLWDRLEADWGLEATRAIAEAHLIPPPQDLAYRDPAYPLPDGAERLPCGTVRLRERAQITALPGFAEGAFWAQDAAAHLPAQMIPEPRGKRVLDLCAAPGGKTMQLAAMGADVTALDISARRLERLAENLARTGLAAGIVAADALSWQPEAAFDAILLDAPCSATGTIRRHPDLPHRLRAGDLAPLIALQTALIDRAFGWLAPKGSLIFCTCSLFKAEGEEQIAGFLERQSNARLVPVTLPGLDPLFSDGVLRSRPDHWAGLGHLDGFYAARIDRS
ncbi:MAG: transcription antitermination factor NusB [Pseudomonadota bacterium]